MLQLPYDKGYIEFAFDASAGMHLLSPPSSGFTPSESQEEIVKNAISGPIESDNLAKLAENKKDIVQAIILDLFPAIYQCH